MLPRLIVPILLLGLLLKPALHAVRIHWGLSLVIRPRAGAARKPTIVLAIHATVNSADLSCFLVAVRAVVESFASASMTMAIGGSGGVVLTSMVPVGGFIVGSATMSW